MPEINAGAGGPNCHVQPRINERMCEEGKDEDEQEEGQDRREDKQVNRREYSMQRDKSERRRGRVYKGKAK